LQDPLQDPLQVQANEAKAEWHWLCGDWGRSENRSGEEKGESNAQSHTQLNAQSNTQLNAQQHGAVSSWPALQALAQPSHGGEPPRDGALGADLLSALHAWQEGAPERAGQWPSSFSGLLWLGWLQQAEPVAASEQRKQWQRSLHGQHPLLADLLSQWAGDRHGQAVGLFDTLQLPVDELHWGYLWLDLCALARHGGQSPQVAMLHKWDLTHLLDATPYHRLMAFCQDLLRSLLNVKPHGAPLRQLHQGDDELAKAEAKQGSDEADGKGVDESTDDSSDDESGAASASWLNWLQGLGRSSGVSKPQERLVWLLHADGPELECKIQKLSTKGEWTAGRRVDPALLASQYAAMLDEHDWALVRTLPRVMERLPREVWEPLADHPRLLNTKGHKLQLAISAPLLRVVASESGMSAQLSPEGAARGAHIVPLADDLWQLILTPQALIDRLPALESIPLLPAEGLTELQRTLDGIADLPWHSQVAGLQGNTELGPWPGVPAVQLDWQDGQLSIKLVTREGDLPPQPLGKGEAIIRQGIKAYHYWQRDLGAEKRQAQLLRNQLPIGLPGSEWLLQGEPALALVNALPELVDSGIVIHWHQDSARLKSLDEAALSLRIERRQDWFQVEGALALDEHQILDLRLILRQMVPGQRTVQLDEKTSLMLSDKLVERLTM
ncbi:MAG: DEAD/DEAH box helicase, partial [Aeromonas sp.]